MERRGLLEIRCSYVSRMIEQDMGVCYTIRVETDKSLQK